MRRFLIICVLTLGLAAPAVGGTLFVIDGRGWGHGVGMSQYGAQGYAAAGWRYPRILAHYYRGTDLQILPGRQVRVLLLQGRAGVGIGSSKPFRLVDARGKRRTLKRGDRRLLPVGRKGFRFPLRFEPGASPLRLDGSPYRGVLTVHRVGGRLTAVNRLPLDRYLRGVVPWEMPYYWHPEALKAQAVVARSYALATLKPGTLFDLYADTRSQLYGGIGAEKISTNRAIAASAGRVLLWQGRVATTFYHSTSGGRTAPITDVWPNAAPLPYLVSVSDPYDGISKHHRWGPVVLTPEEVARKIRSKGVRDLLVEKTPSGRAAAVDVAARQGVRTILAQDFRRELGLRSTWFTVRVLNLDPPLRRALADRTMKLNGFVRGLRRVRLEKQVNGGAWTVVTRVRTRADGRFTVPVKPRRTTSYRLATGDVAGATITVVPR
ncbi:MAG: SpoIID/LytB domain-containing protein [Actinobacteria bacterium]|nr:SpoIID/LytB domain-containing protein [Actinomycetota bacterium]